MSGPVTILPVRGIGEVGLGDDLAGLVADLITLEPGDVVVIAQKVVSKAEGAVAGANPGEDPFEARRRLAREQARRVVADTPWVLVTETTHGLVCANGGIDASNAPEGQYVLLPDDSDASARRIREGLRARTGFDVPVVVTDTFGRPWRMGQTDVAIGLSGLAPIRDERGGTDRAGKALDVTEAAVADELAAAADLVRGKADGVPVVVVRGWEATPDDDAGIADLVRPSSDDLFPRGAGMLARELAGDLGDPPTVGGGGHTPLSGDDLAIVGRVARRVGTTFDVRSTDDRSILVWEADTARAAVAAGMAVAALVDLGCSAHWRFDDGAVVVEASRPRRVRA